MEAETCSTEGSDSLDHDGKGGGDPTLYSGGKGSTIQQEILPEPPCLYGAKAFVDTMPNSGNDMGTSSNRSWFEGASFDSIAGCSTFIVTTSCARPSLSILGPPFFKASYKEIGVLAAPPIDKGRTAIFQNLVSNKHLQGLIGEVDL